MEIISFQQEFCPEPRKVQGNVDYTNFERMLKMFDELLVQGGVERDFVERSVKRYKLRSLEANLKATDKQIQRHEKHAVKALRCQILLCLLGESYRSMSIRLAECPLYRWFCRIENFGLIRVPSKSTLQEFGQWLPEEELRAVVGGLLAALTANQSALNFANDIELEKVWLDSTVLKTPIHFPVDWTLLRDAVRTLMKATELIRKHGLKSRMDEPKEFMKEMNRLCIAMTQSRRNRDSKRQRKKTLRRMKRLVKVVREHAERHRNLLDKEWEQTDWTRKQAEQVLRRIDGILAQLPQALKQAHERIIGERPVKNAEKILSLYEPDTKVIVRGKADAEVEFGNKLLIAEQRNGLIVDWKLYCDSTPSDSQILKDCIERIEARTGAAIVAVTTDRGFVSAANVDYLNQRGIYNGICPKSPQELTARLSDPKFASFQERRSSTEARIGIFKNGFCGRPMRIKGFERRSIAITWRVLAHNLWVLARLPQASTEQALARAA